MTSGIYSLALSRCAQILTEIFLPTKVQRRHLFQAW